MKVVRRGGNSRFIRTRQLSVDLGESITICVKVEAYITTDLFLFLIASQISPLVDGGLIRTKIIIYCWIYLWVTCLCVVG